MVFDSFKPILYCNNFFDKNKAPGSKGEQLTVLYVQSHFEKLGLRTYIQEVPMIGLTPKSARFGLRFQHQEDNFLVQNQFVKFN